MFEFLRNFRDEAAAEISLMGIGGVKTEAKKDNFTKHEKSEDLAYLRNLDEDYGFINEAIMKMIISNKLEGKSPEVIYESIGNNFISVKRINETLQAYSIMNYMKGKGYSAEEAGNIMKVANIYDSNKDKTMKEIAEIADCTIDSVESVVKILNDFRVATVNQKPFTVESTTANSGQKDGSKQTSKASNKKDAKATA